MNRILVASFAVALLGASSSFGQAPAAPAAAPAAPAAPAAAPTRAYGPNSFLAAARTTWETTRTGVLAVANNIPEDKLDWRPGTDATVRSFKAQLQHLADENYNFFGTLSGDTAGAQALRAPISSLNTKAELIKALTDSYTWAAAKFDALTEAQAMEMVAGRGGAMNQRWSSILTAIWDNRDHYGNIVTMLRANDIVPNPRGGRAGAPGGGAGRGGAPGGGGAPAGAPPAGAPPAGAAPRGM